MTDPEPISDSDSAAHQRLEKQEADFYVAFRREQPVLWWGTLAGPFVTTALILSVLWLEFGGKYVSRLVGTASVVVFFGKVTILAGESDAAETVRRFFSREELLLLTVYVELFVATTMAFHTGVLFKLPYFGPKLRDVVRDGRALMKRHRWLKRMTFSGLVVFMALPIPATGSFSGSILGRLLGLSRAGTFLALLVGSLIGCGLMYFQAGLIRKYLVRDDPVMLALGLALIGAVTFLLNRRYKRMTGVIDD